jgi:hypothetical protein
MQSRPSLQPTVDTCTGELHPELEMKFLMINEHENKYRMQNTDSEAFNYHPLKMLRTKHHHAFLFLLLAAFLLTQRNKVSV